MKVLKFGGTSVGSPDRIREVVRIIESQDSPCVIVVSAYQGITDELKKVSELASERDEEYKALSAKIISKHEDFIKELVRKEAQVEILKKSEAIFKQLNEILNGPMSGGALCPAGVTPTAGGRSESRTWKRRTPTKNIYFTRRFLGHGR